MEQAQVKELLLQSLEHERGGIQVYENAIKCALNDDLKEEWGKYLEQTRNHERILLRVFKELGLDAGATSPGPGIVKQLGQALVQALKPAKKAAKPEAAEIVACECVVLAETKDHADWELITKAAEKATGKQRTTLQAAADEVEE